jgi:hypothetical protein
MIIAAPLSTAYRNEGEYGYKIGIEVYDSNGDAVDVTGDVVLLYQDLDGTIVELEGDSDGNTAFYEVEDGDFLISGTYRYWIQCFDRERYGPYELKIMLVGDSIS